MLTPDSKIFVAGHRGMVGSAIWQELERRGFKHLIGRASTELDLRDQTAVRAFLADAKPDAVVLAAAKVGGILANDRYPADFLHDNLLIQTNVIAGSHAAGVKRLLFLGSTCIYPKLCPQPIKEGYLLSGPLEPTNEAYAVAKIAGIKLCESFNRQHGTDYRAVMPTNLYGPNDNFAAENSHVIPALMRRFHEAKVSEAPKVVVWGSGKPLREFLHVDDMAAASAHVLLMEPAGYREFTQPRLLHVNVGTGVDVSIKELAETIAKVVGYEGIVAFDASKPDGTPRKLCDVSLLKKMGWSAEIGLEEGLKTTYEWYLAHEGELRK